VSQNNIFVKEKSYLTWYHPTTS